MSRIRIIKTNYALDEHQLSSYEGAGLTLISVNHVITHEYPDLVGIAGLDKKHEVVRWTYHFRRR